MEFSIGICAYNEEKNIGCLLENLINHETQHKLEEIIVVSSGCKDRTEEIIKELQKKDKRIKLIVEKERRGKPSAFNKILMTNKSPILVMTDADTLFGERTIDNLLNKFDNETGAVNGRTVPFKNKSSFWDFVAKFRYMLYHEVAMDQDKKGKLCHVSGYLYAMKKGLIKNIPNILNDDGYVGVRIYQDSYKIKYAPDALVYIRHPTNLSDFISQRKRVALAHIQLENLMKHKTATRNMKLVLPLALKRTDWTLKKLIYLPIVIILEFYASSLAKFHATFGKISTTKSWKSLESPKSLK